MRKWMAVFGVALMVSSCSNNPSRPATGSNASVATPASNSQLGDALPQEDLSRFVQPSYPGFDALFGIEGTTMVYVTIAPDGHVLNARVDKSSGHNDLDDSAVAAVRQSFFVPARKNGSNIISEARVPVSFNANYSKYGMWPSSYLNPHYVLDTRPFPYPSVASALEGLSAQSVGSSNSDGHLTTFKLFGSDGSTLEEWVFADLGTSRQMAIRFVFTGAPLSPEVMVSAICQEGAAACVERTSWLLKGPSFARGIQQ
ncbi:TonB family protein [Dyella sp. Tek66A03]|uniref:TonB family protein n=1 Tax=Dyella sp. Tek66A03 TaxID=3458298 RepID=UPI00403E4513